MKNIKTLVALIILSGSMLVGFQSCSQYPDNNGITLVSKADRVSKAWKVENYKLNDADYTSLVSGYTETFTKQGAYSFQWAVLGGTANWAFQNKDAEIQLTDISNVTTKTLIILKLEEDAFWYYYMDGSDKKEFHMVPQ
ncbi:MAG: hypothetical protein PHS59_02870 [Paludibacter sp.]|nr:hypothetical protein [Paludibacter sp.]